MIEVVSAAAHQRLTTVAALRLQLPAAAVATSDEDLQALIDRVSAGIAIYCGRSFASEQVRETWVHRHSPRELLLSRFPVASLDAFTVNGDAVDLDGLLCDRTIGLIFHGCIGSAGSTVVATYTAGYVLPGDEGADLPDDLEQAALSGCAALYALGQRHPNLKAEEIAGVGRWEFFAGRTASLSYFGDVLPLLDPYRVPEAR